VLMYSLIQPVMVISLPGQVHKLRSGGKVMVHASRCISADHAAHSSLRVQPIVRAIGQAGGIAAALCVKDKIKPEEVDTQELRKLLLEQGAFI